MFGENVPWGPLMCRTTCASLESHSHPFPKQLQHDEATATDAGKQNSKHKLCTLLLTGYLPTVSRLIASIGSWSIGPKQTDLYTNTNSVSCTLFDRIE